MDASDQLLKAPAFTRLGDLGFVALDGARALDFLQGQLTCDMRQATRERAMAGAWCTPKGRVLCSLMAWPEAPDRVILRMHADLLGSTSAQLSRYAALSRVRIGTPGLRCLGLLGALDAGTRARLGLPETRAAGDVQTVPEGALLQLDADGLRHEFWVREDAESDLSKRWQEAIPDVREDLWRLALVRAGVAEVRAATQELFLPQMLGYDIQERVSFKKGCYTGQEIVARTHYKGGVKRHLHRLEGHGEPPPVGTALESAGQNAGTVVEAAASGDGRCELLAVLADEFTADATGVRFVAGGREFSLPA